MGRGGYLGPQCTEKNCSTTDWELRVSCQLSNTDPVSWSLHSTKVIDSKGVQHLLPGLKDFYGLQKDGHHRLASNSILNPQGE